VAEEVKRHGASREQWMSYEAYSGNGMHALSRASMDAKTIDDESNSIFSAQVWATLALSAVCRKAPSAVIRTLNGDPVP
jgi:hypothetical protein